MTHPQYLALLRITCSSHWVVFEHTSQGFWLVIISDYPYKNCQLDKSLPTSGSLSWVPRWFPSSLPTGTCFRYASRSDNMSAGRVTCLVVSKGLFLHIPNDGLYILNSAVQRYYLGVIKWLSCISITATKHHNQNQPEKKRIYFSLQFIVHHRGSWGRNSRQNWSRDYIIECYLLASYT